MARNLCSTVCVHCDHPVKLLENPRLIEEKDAGGYFREFEGMTVAEAQCPMCKAQYLAWVSESNRKKHARPAPDYGNISDLSYLSTFNDEPGPDDVPRYDVQKIVTWHRIAKLG